MRIFLREHDSKLFHLVVSKAWNLEADGFARLVSQKIRCGLLLSVPPIPDVFAW
jgi:hypothetical protein